VAKRFNAVIALRHEDQDDGQMGKKAFHDRRFFLLLLGMVHALSLFKAPVPANDTERQLLGLMSDYQFNVMGSMRSMDYFLRGFSISFMLAALVMGAVGLVLGRERAGLLKRVALVNTIWLAAGTAVSFHYFFVIPTSFLASALLIFTLAWLNLPQSVS
jgi:hypothetical protein